MKYMTGNEIRKAYLQFFKSKEHLILHSFPLIPENDPVVPRHDESEVHPH